MCRLPVRRRANCELNFLEEMVKSYHMKNINM